MLGSINKLLKDMSDKYPDWDKLIVETLSSSEVTDNGLNALDKFTSILKNIIEMLKSEVMCLEDVKNLFEAYECRDYTIKYISANLQTYHNFDALRKLENDDIYKAKKCVDQIWESYILRYNPFFDNQENVLLSANDYRSVAKEIDRIIDLCIENNLHVFAILKQVEDRSELSHELCEYISKKIDEDFDKLKLNYIIYNINNK
ncbi:MAG: hypothetical protein U0L18_01525 [Acutalibacteraceae bacterium]|nr:hypothetical protein [Acutalibacteraceae bacterium]